MSFIECSNYKKQLIGIKFKVVDKSVNLYGPANK